MFFRHRAAAAPTPREAPAAALDTPKAGKASGPPPMTVMVGREALPPYHHDHGGYSSCAVIWRDDAFRWRCPQCGDNSATWDHTIRPDRKMARCTEFRANLEIIKSPCFGWLNPINSQFFVSLKKHRFTMFCQ